MYIDNSQSSFKRGDIEVQKITPEGSRQPLVSVVTVCKNSERTIRRCVESVLAQDYSNFEYIIMDGVSTDRTLEIIEEYNDVRIKLISEFDSGASEAYYKGLRRCAGEIITLCWADEELLPHALTWGVSTLTRHPDVAAIYGDVYPTDIDGKVLPNGRLSAWDLEKHICWEMMPNYCASFMRSRALWESGFFEFNGSFYDNGKTKLADTSCTMYDYYTLVGLKNPIHYVPEFVGKFSIHKGQLSSTPEVIFDMLPGLFRSIDNVCNNPATPPKLRELKERAYAGVQLMMLNTLIVNAKDYESAKTMLRNALIHAPDMDFLRKVFTESFNILLRQDKNSCAQEFIDIVEASGKTFPGFRYLQGVIALITGRIDAARQVIRLGRLEDPEDQKIVSLEKIFAAHKAMEQAILTRKNKYPCLQQEEKFVAQVMHVILLGQNLKHRRLSLLLGARHTPEMIMDSCSMLCDILTNPDYFSDEKRLDEETIESAWRLIAAVMMLANSFEYAELTQPLAEIFSVCNRLKQEL